MENGVQSALGIATSQQSKEIVRKLMEGHPITQEVSRTKEEFTIFCGGVLGSRLHRYYEIRQTIV